MSKHVNAWLSSGIGGVSESVNELVMVGRSIGWSVGQ